jgi:hypothetical protein
MRKALGNLASQGRRDAVHGGVEPGMGVLPFQELPEMCAQRSVLFHAALAEWLTSWSTVP